MESVRKSKCAAVRALSLWNNVEPRLECVYNARAAAVRVKETCTCWLERPKDIAMYMCLEEINQESVLFHIRHRNSACLALRKTSKALGPKVNCNDAC
jgi:hypothetical protein